MCFYRCAHTVGTWIGTLLSILCCCCVKSPQTAYDVVAPGENAAATDDADDENGKSRVAGAATTIALRAQRIAIIATFITTIGALVSIASLGVAIYITQENEKLQGKVDDILDHFGI